MPEAIAHGSASESASSSVLPVPSASVADPDGNASLQRSLAAAQSSVTILNEALDACSRIDFDVGPTPNVSLVTYETKEGIIVTYMQWRTGGVELEGQRINADASHRLKYSVHFAVPYRRRSLYKGLQCLHPDCGVRVWKVTGADKPPVPADRVQLRRLWELAFANSDRETVVSVNECQVCHTIAETGHQLLMSCALCEQSYHEDCCRVKVLPCLDTTMRLVGGPLPKAFQNDAILCLVCQQLARTLPV
jgi:hypothetical protein